MSKPPAPSDIADKFMLRLPDGMRDRIAGAAKASGRSMNAEIVHRLQTSLDSPEPEPPSEMVSRIAIAVTMQLMQGIQSGLADLNSHEQVNISKILTAAEKELISSFASNRSKADIKSGK